MSYSTAISEQICSTGTNLTLCPEPKELYVLIKDDVVDQIIEHGLSKAESKLFFYFLKLDRFGDRPAKVKVASILLATGISKSAYHTAIVKFETMGWFDFKHSDVEIRNFCTPTKKSRKLDSESKKQDFESRKLDSESRKLDSESKKQDFEELKPFPSKASKTPQTIQTYSDLLKTLSEETRESFEKFCKKKIEECSFKIGSRTAWLNKHGEEYLQEFIELYSYAISNPEVIAPKAETAVPTIESLKRQYGSGWESAAIHFGLIDINFLAVEIQEDTSEAEPHDTVNW